MGDVKVRIAVDNSPLQSGLRRAKENVASFASSTESKLVGLGAKMAAFFSVGAIVQFGRSLLGIGKHLAETSDNLNMTAESFQRLSDVMDKRASLGAEKAEKALTAFAVKLEEAKNGNKDALDSFEKLGVTWNDLHTKSPEQLFYRVMDGIKASSDPIATARDMFGKLGAKMVSMAMEGGAALEELGRQTTVVTNKQVEDLEKVERKFDSYMKKLSSFGMKAVVLGGEALEIIPNAIRNFLKPKEEGGGSVRKAFRDSVDTFMGDRETIVLPDRKKEEAIPEDPRKIEAAKKEAKEIGSIQEEQAKQAIADVLNQVKIEQEQMDKRSEAAAAAADDAKKMAEKETADRKTELEQQVADAKAAADRINTARQTAIQQFLQTPDQKRQARQDARDERRAGRTLEARKRQQEKDRANRSGGVDENDESIFDTPRPGKYGPPSPRLPRQKPPRLGPTEDPAGKGKNDPATSMKEMQSDVRTLTQKVSSLLDKINVA